MAATTGNGPELKYLMKEGEDVNVTNEFYQSLLHEAASYGKLETVKYLIEEKHMSVDLRDTYERTPLHAAARNGVLNLVKYLAGEKRANLYDQDFYYKTLLHQAVIGKNLDVVKYLIDDMKMLPHIEDRDILGLTVAMEAARYGSVPILKYLLDEKRANISAVDVNGLNFLHVAARDNEFDVVRYLIEVKRFDPNLKTPQGETAYNLAKKFNGSRKILEYSQKMMAST